MAIEVATVPSVEIALFDLDVSSEALAAFHSYLSADEQARAEKFRYDRDRNRFIARRGQLRARLGQELDEAPDEIRIHPDAHGKPFLPDHPGLQFSLSHSHKLALCAIGHGVAVGCDIEWRNPELASSDVADRLFAPSERAALAALPEELWVQGFFNCWTRKEAYVKALGLGLFYPLDAFTVSISPDETARLIEAGPGWSLTSFEPAPSYQAALVVGECARPRASAITSRNVSRANRYSHPE